MTQLDENDLCKCSFGVDNVVVLLIIRIIQVILILLTRTNA